MDVKLERLNRELEGTNDADNILRCLIALGIANIKPENVMWYLNELRNDVTAKQQVRTKTSLWGLEDFIQVCAAHAFL